MKNIFLEKYIEENLKRGVDLKQIRAMLLTSRHPKEQIDGALRSLYKRQVVDLAKYINTQLKTGLKPGAIRNYLSVMGHSKSSIDIAMQKVVNAKKYQLRQKKIEKTKEQFRAVNRNIKRNLSRYWDNVVSKVEPIWENMTFWEKTGFIPGAIALFVFILWELLMIFRSFIISGGLNCYSFGRVITCSFIDSIIYYFLMFIVFVILSAVIFGLGALVGYIIEKVRG